MPFAAFDCAMCANCTCPHWSGEPRCGRSTKAFEGINIIVQIGSFRPDENGVCRYQMEPTEWKIEQWMLDMAQRYADEYQAEESRKSALKAANALDADDLDREV